MKKSIKVFISVTFALIILGGAGGTGVYFGVIKKDTVIKPISPIENYPQLPINKVVIANSLMQKDNPQIRNGYGFSCDYSVSIVSTSGEILSKENWENPYLNRIDEEDKVIVCAFINSPPSTTPLEIYNLNNDFPLIIFNNLNWDLANNGLDPTINKSNDEDKKNAILNNESDARKAAKVISDNLFKNLSFSGELINLDSIIFHPLDANGKANGIYSEIYKSIALQPWWSTRVLNLFISPIKSSIDPNPPFYSPGYIPFENDELKNISFDLYETYKTLAHEYGHHVTLHNGLFDSQKFLNELQQVFYDDGNNQAFTDFVEMYKYFNSMNSDNSLNFKDALTKDASKIEADEITLNVGAMNTLKLFRKYYSYNVDTVYNLIYNNSFGLTPYLASLHILESLNKRQEEGMVNPVLLSYVNEINKNNEINKEKLKDYYLAFYNRNQLNTTSNSGSSAWIDFRYVPDSFDLDVDRSSELQVKDIFPNMKTVDWKTNNEIENMSCLELGYNFHGSVYNFDLAKFYNNKFTTESEFKSQSIKTDKDILSSLQYYFSTNELLARMHAVLTYKYPDKRSYIDQCSFDTVSNNRRKLYLSNTNFEDYGFFRSFGMNLLKNDNERILYKMLTHDEDLVNNQARVYKNIIKKASNEISNPNPDDEVPYSFSSRIVINKEEENLNGYPNVHFIINLKLENPEEAFWIKLQYKSSEPISPLFYDYRNPLVVVNDIDDNIENADNLDVVSVILNTNEAKKHVSLVFKLLNIQGEESNNGKINILSLLNGNRVNYDILKDFFKWSSSDDKPLLFIDKNYDNKFNKGDIKLEFV